MVEDHRERDERILAAIDRVRGRVQAGKKLNDEEESSREGTSVVGAGTRRAVIAGYVQQVKQHVMDSWIVAERKVGLIAIVSFGILATGDIFDLKIAQPSGSVIYDESAIRAVRKASPLPPPPSRYRRQFAEQKVEVLFGEMR